ncbi:MAG TPA: hypothetical protein VLM43_09995, partial [Desulfobacterales bacterium]|nr:hypothetical protein [Desulfobacterales bacterium]
ASSSIGPSSKVLEYYLILVRYGTFKRSPRHSFHGQEALTAYGISEKLVTKAYDRLHEKYKEQGWIDADNFSRLDFKIKGILVQHPIASDYYLMLIANTELDDQP